MKPRWFEMTDDEYFAQPGLSSSALRCFSSEGAWRYYHQQVAKTFERNYSDALRVGHAFHLAMEVGEDWKDHIYQEPGVIGDDPAYHAVCPENPPDHFAPGLDINKKSPVHRAYLFEHAQTHSHQIRLTPEEVIECEQQLAAVYENPEAVEIIEAEGLAEHACFRECEKTGLLLKCKPDKVIGNTIIDFKTTRHFTPAQFVKDAVGYDGRGGKGYQFQAEWYSRVTRLEAFKIVAITKGEAPECFVFEIPQYIMEIAAEANDSVLFTIATRQLQDDWHSTGHGAVIPLDPNERCPL